MQEEWLSCPSLPAYEISTLGRVRHAASKNIRMPGRNNQGFSMINVRVDGKVTSRAVATLVADTYLGMGYHPRFNSVIHLNTDRGDCRPENLMRRPRDFAIEYHGQFDPFKLARFGPMHIKYREVMTQEVYENITVPARRFGLLCRKIYFSACNRGGEPVWPTEQRFVFDHW